MELPKTYETVARFGDVESIAHNVEENFAQTRGAIEKYLGPEDADEIVRWQTAFVRGHEALFERRMASGRVRDGHGDLRLPSWTPVINAAFATNLAVLVKNAAGHPVSNVSVTFAAPGSGARTTITASAAR